MAEYLEIPQFVVSPPNFEVVQQGLALINSESDLLPQIAGLGAGEQAMLLEQWYALHDPTYVSYEEYEEIFFSTNVNDLTNFAKQGLNNVFEGIGASEAAKEWIVEGEKVTGTGAAVAGEKIAYDYATSLAANSAGTTSVMSILSMNLPTAAAAMAPLIGFSLGWLLYEAAPDFWTNISKTLLPWCYPDTELMPVMADDKGNTYYPKDAVEALRSFFNSQQSNTFATTVAGVETEPTPFDFIKKVPGKTVHFNVPGYGQGEKTVRTYNASDDIFVGMFTSLNSGPTAYIPFYVILCSKKPFTVEFSPFPSESAKSTVYNGETIYFYNSIYSTTGEPTSTDCPINKINANIDYTFDWPAFYYSMLFGASQTLGVPGVSPWSGVEYPADVETIDILGPAKEDKQSYYKIPYIPIATPTGRPGESVSVDTQDLTTNPNPNAAIEPWITTKPQDSTYPEDTQTSPKPAPLPSILPNPTTVTDPLENPSTKPQTLPQPLVQTKVPTDTGTTTKPQNPNSIPFLPGDGLIHVYNPSASEVQAFGKWLWTTFSGDIIETVSKLFNNPMDAVIGLHELYASPNVAGTANIKAGYLTSNVSSAYIGNRYSSINCGTIIVPEYYQNYLDYSPYTKCFVYLPFIGIVPIQADDAVGNAVNITYNIDSFTGSCIAIITVAREGYDATVYQFEGNCAVELPISSGYQSTLMGGLLGLAGAALTGNPHVGLSAANLGRASLGKNDVSHSGSFGASYGAMGAKSPYIIVKRPSQKSVVNYNDDYGFPAHTRVVIGSCSGYLRAREVHVISPTATDEEKARIEELLKSGVFVQ